jgi:DNA ligase (NAD+)
MLSLSNQFSYDDMKKFDNDIKKLTGLNEVEYNVEPKIDGLSISLIYEKGILTQAITRGDGEFGEDVTNNIKTIKTIPLKINNHFDRFEVRGEVFLSFKEFEKINSKIENEDDKFANPRNAAAGSLRNLDSSIAADRHLQMIAYYIPNDDDLIKLNIHKQSDVVATLKKLGFNTANEIKKCSNIDDVISVIEDFTNNREQIPYPIDGVVIKENNINLYDTIGRTSKFPK